MLFGVRKSLLNTSFRAHIPQLASPLIVIKNWLGLLMMHLQTLLHSLFSVVTAAARFAATQAAALHGLVRRGHIENQSGRTNRVLELLALLQLPRIAVEEKALGTC